ncbi:6-phosphogluconate dehydrogenase family protein [Penicillium digitatum]|uniref:6-phosphogluconate dehydrogenase family protein n=3 Tax=Penicillium digitatum TaxID=36651 RepID=K9FAD4_PEND2|nr:6-phosphogluconate dehydrogenase family protein [Penicillium digitatum Pd1]EKV06154.1 6-phosphogluconate dehydrogenase family protein [Penicillium digitatum PHI26]EKV18283.1 6-phosphogluconate dehydrogenase family protein [Penicillium digitatum Pd1]QQK47131.1 6-phosphogluconate dehydrogenase family protein [Penicillium digitatum]
MATNLQRHLAAKKTLGLIYSNRTMSRGAALQALGAIPEPNFEKLVSQYGIIFTMVSNDTVLQRLLSTVVGSSQSLKDKVFVDCSTVHPETRRSSAGPQLPWMASLSLPLVVPKSATEAVKPLIQDVMGRRVIDCGEDATKSSLLKIAGNIITVNIMEAVGEAQVFAEKTGLGTGPMEELIGEALGSFAGGYSKRLTADAYAPPLNSRPGFRVSLAIRDSRHAMSMAQEQGVELPGLEIARANMEAAREYGGECLDSSAMYGTLRQKAGLEFWNEKSRRE